MEDERGDAADEERPESREPGRGDLPRRVADALSKLRTADLAPRRRAKARSRRPQTDPPPPIAEPAVSSPTEDDAPPPEASGPPERDADAEPVPSEDDAIRAARDAAIEPLAPDLLRAAKRLLQDEQNLLLDAGRRARKRLEASRLLPDATERAETTAETLAPALDVAYSSGRTVTGKRRTNVHAPERLVKDLATTLVMPLHERLAATIDDVAARGPYASLPEQHRELVSAIGARYREWRSRDLAVHVGDVLAAAYARGAYDATPRGTELRWVPDAPGHCPDCDDNALEPTPKGKPFPTGQSHPPAHPGCRCLVVPVARA